MTGIKGIQESFRIFGSKVYIQEIFDTVQSHAVYGIDSKDTLSQMKHKLKLSNCSKFRTIKLKNGCGFILCFKLN